MTYNPNILTDALRARSLTRAQLSHRLGISLPELERELGREPEPKQNILNNIAKELALPSFIFFMARTPPISDDILDFRSETPGPSEKSRATIESIEFAKGVQNTVVEFDVPPAANLPRFEVIHPNRVEEFALEARAFFQISLRDQANAKDARAFYTVCRKKIEDKGIFVLHDSFPSADGSGFCLWHPTHPIIVINTKQQTRGRRLFTLIHELGHVLMHRSGISDPFINRNATERLCNRFAGSFLVPESYVSALLNNVTPSSDPNPEDVAWAARRLKVSQQAAVLRLEQLQFFKAGSHDKWMKVIHNIGNPDFSEQGGGAGGPPPQEKVKLAKYGFQFARAFDSLLREGRISEINLYRSTGLKPKYQRAYFEYANSITADGLHALELDDE